MTIQRQTISGTGDGTVNTSGYAYVTSKSNGGPIRIEYVYGGVNHVAYFDADRKIVVPVTTFTVKAPASVSWSFTMWSQRVPADQSYLQISVSDAGYSTSGDEYIRSLGQGTEASADISGLRVSAEELSKLFSKALTSHSVADAARYCKMRTAVFASF